MVDSILEDKKKKKEKDKKKDKKAMKEILNKRTLNRKVFDNGDGTFTANCHIGDINYKKDEDTHFGKIDTTLIPTVNGWEMRKASYEIEIPKYADGLFNFINNFIFVTDGLMSNNLIKHGLPEETLQTKPIGVNHVEGELITSGSFANKEIIYRDAFDTDIDLLIRLQNSTFNKIIVINNKPDDLSEDLTFNFELISNKDLKFTADELIWDKETAFDISNGVMFGDKKKSWIKKIKLWDSSSNQPIICNTSLEYVDGKIYLTKIIPKKYLEDAVYPVYIDASVSYDTGANDGFVGRTYESAWTDARDAVDGDSRSSTTWGIVSGRYYSFYGYWLYDVHRSFLPVDTSGLPDTATITSATFWFNVFIHSNTPDLCLIQTTQDPTTALTTSDFTAMTINSPSEGASRKNITVTGWTSMALDATGLPWISKTSWTKLGLRELHDVDDVTPTVDNRAEFYTSEQAGKEPYLEIVYSTSAISALKKCVGTAWVTIAVDKIKRYNGTSWVTAKLKRWSGAAWVDVT